MADADNVPLPSQSWMRTLAGLTSQDGAPQPVVPTLPPSTTGIDGSETWKAAMAAGCSAIARVPDPRGPAMTDDFPEEGIGPLPPSLPAVYVPSPEEVQDADDVPSPEEVQDALEEKWDDLDPAWRNYCHQVVLIELRRSARRKSSASPEDHDPVGKYSHGTSTRATTSSASTRATELGVKSSASPEDHDPVDTSHGTYPRATTSSASTRATELGVKHPRPPPPPGRIRRPDLVRRCLAHHIAGTIPAMHAPPPTLV